MSVDYGYDNLNRLSTVLDNRLTAGADTTTYTYDPDSDLQTTTLPNGVLTSATFNTLDRLTRLTSTKSATLADYNYTILGAAGERKQVVELSGRQVDYGYDNAYRLTSETISVVSPGSLVATYDHTGDRLTRTSTVTGIAAASATYDANDRQSGITYDNNGNTTIASGVTYGYDFLNRLTSATGSITLKYDGDGNRVQETAGGVTTNFLVDDNNPSGVPQVVEELVGGVVQRQYTYGHTLISQNQSSGVSFYGMDASHNVRFLTNTAGAITDQYTYDAFGSLISSSGTTPNSYRFAGEHLDSNLGLYYLRARYYNAGTGRFWSRDTAEMNPDDPRELNRYVYTADNPVNATDPTGRGLYDYRAITEAVAQNTQNVAGELGSEVQLALGRVASEFLAIEARQIERDAVALWEFAHNQKFPYRKRGELGAGLGRYEGVDGANHGIAAFNDIGLQGGPRDAPFTADQRAAYEELHAIMERELIGRGYEIVHRSEFVDVTRAQAGHEEDFLMQAYRERASVTAIGSINVTGVPQRTICSRCNFSHAGGTGTADEFVALISEEREIQAVVAGHDLAVAEGLLPLIP